MAWRSWTERLIRLLGREARRRQALADVRGDAASLVTAMVRRTLGTGGPFDKLSNRQWNEAFEDLPAIGEGIDRLQALLAARRKIRAGRTRRKGRAS